MGVTSKKRLYVVFSFFSILLGLLAVRLYFIQIDGSYEYQSTYASQHMGSLSGIGYRGTIHDRNGALLTNDQTKYIYLIEKTKLDDTCQSLLSNVYAERITVDSRRYAAFEGESYEEELSKRLESDYGAFIFSTVGQFSDDQPAAHLIGYLNRLDNSGAFGLERSFDKALYSDQELRLVVDAAGRLLPGYGVERQGKNPGGKVMTTLDTSIQQKVEEAFQKSAKKGSVSVVDVQTGQLLAGASFPAFNPNDVAKSIESGEDELRNKLIQSSYPPGSVFKIIVAAAALENNIADLDTEFTCTGAEELYGIRIKCSKEEGHGTINLTQAFAQSCNCAFIQLGEKVGDEKLLKMAKAFGVGKEVLNVLEEEAKGVLPSMGDLQGAGIGNFSIGQGRLEMTNMQVTRMTSIIANGGIVPDIRLVDIASDGNGIVVYEHSQELGDITSVSDNYSSGSSFYLGTKNKSRIISPVTAEKIMKIMKQTVLTGTAKRIEYNAAGKTGSAQSYQSGKKVVHGWFTGFFPAEDPQYAVTVFVENGGGAKPAIEIFNEIAKSLDCPEKPEIPSMSKENWANFGAGAASAGANWITKQIEKEKEQMNRESTNTASEDTPLLERYSDSDSSSQGDQDQTTGSSAIINSYY